MTTTAVLRDSCRLCSSKDLRLALHLNPTPIADNYHNGKGLGNNQETFPLEVLLCLACGSAQLSHVVDANSLYLDFVYETTTSPGLEDHFRRFADEVLNIANLPAGSLVVDIGSNDGTLLKSIQKRNMRVLGVDPAREIAARATKAGVETLAAFFTPQLASNIINEHGQAGLVTSNNTIANADDLEDIAAGICRLIAPDGIFVFETLYLLDLVQECLFDNIYHEHLSYLSVRALDLFFSSHGMVLVDVQRVATKGGSIRGVAQLTYGPHPISSSVAELMALEDSLGLQTLMPFQTMADRLEQAKTQLGDMLTELKGKGKTIVGYGASHSVTTLIHNFDVGNQISFLVDDNPGKQGRFSPGYNIPVLPPQAIYEKRPDYIVILAWRFSEAIIENHRAYLEQGGHFIVPLPRLDVI